MERRTGVEDGLQEFRRDGCTKLDAGFNGDLDLVRPREDHERTNVLGRELATGFDNVIDGLGMKGSHKPAEQSRLCYHKQHAAQLGRKEHDEGDQTDVGDTSEDPVDRLEVGGLGNEGQGQQDDQGRQDLDGHRVAQQAIDNEEQGSDQEDIQHVDDRDRQKADANDLHHTCASPVLRPASSRAARRSASRSYALMISATMRWRTTSTLPNSTKSMPLMSRNS